MVKKNSKNGSKTGGAVEKPDWAPTGVFDSSDNDPSLMKALKLEEVKLMFNSEVHAMLPKAEVGIDWHCKGWISFLYYPFELGMKFPFSKLTEGLLTSMDMSPGQLMPTTWRILACLDAIEEKHELRIDVNVVSYAYTTKKFNNARYGLVAKKKGGGLVPNLKIVNDRGWKTEFFFAEKSTLEDGGDYLRDH